VSFVPLQSPPLHIRRRCFQLQRLPWGCGPSSRHDRPASVQRESQLPPPFRPRRFTRPRRFSPPAGSWVYFTPLPRPGFALQGISLAHSRNISSMLRALSSLAPPRCLGCPKRHASSPRPQGFDPCESPWLQRRGLAVAEARSPRGFLLLQVLRLSVAPMPSHQLPLVTLMRARRCRSRIRSSAFTAAEPDILSRGCRPARGSLPAAHRFLSSAMFDEASVLLRP